MITLAQIDQAICEAVTSVSAVAALGDARLAFPDIVSDPPRPFVLIDHVPTEWTDRTVTGGSTVASGYVDASVVFSLIPGANIPAVNARSSRPSANDLADAIIAAFPKGRRIDVGFWCLVISEPSKPVARGGFKDGADWRVPVRITYQTETA